MNGSAVVNPRAQYSGWVSPLCWIAVALEGFDLVVLGVVLPALLKYDDWGLNPNSASVISVVGLVGVMVGALAAGTISDLIAYRRRHDNLIAERAQRPVHSVHGGDWMMRVFADETSGAEHVVLTKGDLTTDEPVMVRMHALDPLHDVLGIGREDAGELSAAMRLIDLALPMTAPGQALRFAFLPEGQDPDDLIRAKGAGAMSAILDEARPLVDLLWRRETEGRVFDSPERRAALDKALGDAIAKIADKDTRDHYFAALKDLKWQLFSNRRRNDAPSAPRPAPAGGRGRGNDARFQPVWLRDVAEAVVNGLNDDAPIGQTYECCGPEVWTLRDIVKAAGQWAGVGGGDGRPVIGLPGALGRLQALALELLPGQPLMSRDNLDSMAVDNVASGQVPGLEALGITPAPLSGVGPLLLGSAGPQAQLDRYRRSAGR